MATVKVFDPIYSDSDFVAVEVQTPNEDGIASFGTKSEWIGTINIDSGVFNVEIDGEIVNEVNCGDGLLHVYSNNTGIHWRIK